MLRRKAHADDTLGAWLPLGYLFTIGDSVIEQIDGAAPDVKVVELPLRPASPGEDINRRNSCRDVWDMIV